MPLGDDIPLPGTLVQYRTPGLVYESGSRSAASASSMTAAHETPSHEPDMDTAVTGDRPAAGRQPYSDKLAFSATALFADGEPGRTGSDLAATGTAILSKDGQELARADLANCETDQPQGATCTRIFQPGPGRTR